MGLSFSLHGKDKVVPGASYIITPNHQSNADILALIRVLPLRFQMGRKERAYENTAVWLGIGKHRSDCDR